MTLISTKEILSGMELPVEETTPLDKGEGSLDLEIPSFPPVDDAIKAVQSIDWDDVNLRLRRGIGFLLLTAMSFSEKSYDFHQWLYESFYNMKPSKK